MIEVKDGGMLVFKASNLTELVKKTKSVLGIYSLKELKSSGYLVNVNDNKI